MSESNPNPGSESVSNENVKRILALLREGDEKINLAGFRDVILVLGNTGSGKSTLTHFLASNNDDLVSSEVGENSGEFIISDTHNKISVNTTIISKTTFPELIIDQETKIVFVDCPGFNDSRNEAYDIAAAYFIKKVLENVKNVKIILTVSYPSLRKGVNRNDFHQLLEHVTILIKHIEKYVDGISLIATKVDNSYNVRNGVATLVPDNSVIQNIAQFLLEVRESTKMMKNLDQVYTSEFKQAKNELFFQGTKTLLDALLQKNGTEYSRLGIFRRPDGPGRLSDIPLLQNGKKVLKRMIKNLKYVPVDMNDIGYAVSDKSKNIINEMVKEIDENIAVDVAQINRILIDHSKELEEKMIDDDMYSLKEYFNSTSKALARITSIDESAKADQLVSRIQENLPDTCGKALQPYFDDVKNLGKFMNFLQDVSDKQFDSFAWKWIKQLEGSVNYVENSLKWYDFLAALHDRLSQYDVQTDTKRFHVPKFNSTESVVLGSHVDFTKFFDEISNSDFLKVVNSQQVGKINIDGIKIGYFNRVIESTLQDSQFRIFFDFKNEFQVIGEHVRLSDVLKIDFLKLCKSVQIYARHTIFIDTDFTRNVDVSIIAPVWDIIGSRTINLNGSPGKHHFVRKAPNGDYHGDQNGHDGMPGKPGESAGHFFGIGDVFKGAENLTIKAVGGTGGIGQHGGDGTAGSDGQSHWISDNDYWLTCDRDQECYTEISYSKSGLLNLNVQGKVTYTKYGSVGGRGGNAGRGGAPGKGGNAGSITLIGAGNTNPSVSLQVGAGEEGGFGLHGDCGRGGIGGANQKAWYYFGTWSSTENYVNRNAGHAQDGETGTCIYYSSLYSSNTVGRQEPAVRDFLYPPSFAITDFRTRIMSNFYNCVNKRRSLEFYKMLQKKEIIRYDNADIIYKELETLETSHNRLSPDISRLIYTFLQERIEEKAKTVVSEGTAQQRKLLDFLSCAVSSKLTRLANRSQSRLVTNRQAYFDLLKTADVAQIRAFFLARANEEMKSAGNFVKIIRNDIYSIIDRTANEIVKLSEKDINNELGSQMLKFKLFSNLRTIVEFLVFSASLAEADLALVDTLRVTSALPSPRDTMSGVDGSLFSSNLGLFEDILGKPIEALRNSVSKERKALKSLGMEYDEISERLLDAEINLQSRKAIAEKSDGVKYLVTINAYLPNDANGKAQDASDTFTRDLKLIEFDADLFLAMANSKIDTESLTLSFDGLQDRVDNIDKTAVELFDLILPVYRTIRKNMIGDRYKPENLMAIRTMVYQTLDDAKSLVYKFIDEFEIDEDLQLMVENLDEAVGQIMAIFNDVLPSHHDRALFKGLHSYLEKEKEWGNNTQNYLTEMVKANALFYEYERLVDVVKKFVSPFDVSNLNDPGLPAIGPSSPYQSSIVSNINLLESQLKSLEQNSENDTVTDDFNGDNQNGAFFVWGHENYQESISKLLLGREVALKASNSNRNRQVLKFNDIKLRFQSDDPNTQQSLDEDLKYFNVVMTHTGSSYFSVCDRIQLINQDAAKFVYNFNDTITQTINNDGTTSPTMSPYTTWIFKLNPVVENASFSLLLPYRKVNLNIELEGRASFVNTHNKTICEKIARSGHQSTPSTVTSNADQSKLVRKRRDVDYSKSEGIFSMKSLKSFNPFNYFIGSEPDPRFEHSSEPQLLDWNHEPNQPTNFSPSFDTNSTLTLIDFIVRNVTKVKPYQSKENSIDADQARMIAVTILDKYEELSRKEHTSETDWEQDDPIKLLGQLEKYILTENYNKIVDLLNESANLDPSTDAESFRQKIVEMVNQSLNGDLYQNTNQRGIYESPVSQGAMLGLINRSDTISNGNFNQSLLE